MNAYEIKHRDLTVPRLEAYQRLFGGDPVKTYPHDLFKVEEDEKFLIDVLVYQIQTDQRTLYAGITSGMSDDRMTDDDRPEPWARHELIQYFRVCTEGHARKLHRMAWAPFVDQYILRCYDTVAWKNPATPGTPWKNAFFLRPSFKSHRDFEFQIEGDPVTLLWHIPISDAELAFKKDHDVNALIDRMDAVKLPWVFDETNRPSLV